MIALTCGMAVSCHKPGCRRCNPAVAEPDVNPVLEAIERAKPYIDDGWASAPGAQVPPSVRIMLQYFRMATNYTIGLGRAEQEAEGFVRDALAIARQRHRDGFYANPYGAPVRRAA